MLVQTPPLHSLSSERPLLGRGKQDFHGWDQARSPRIAFADSQACGQMAHRTTQQFRTALSMAEHRFPRYDKFRYARVMGVLHKNLNSVEAVAVN